MSEPTERGTMSRRRKRLVRLLKCLVAGVVFALAAPPTNVYPALWLGMAALAYVLADADAPIAASRWRRAFTGGACGLAFGLGANVVALRFVPSVVATFTPLPWVAGLLGLILLSLFEGLRFALAAMVCEGGVRLGLPRWASFAIGIFAGTFVMTVFPWSAAGGVTPWPAMIQLADVVGERGVTALMALSAGLLAAAARARAWRPLAAGVAVPLATLAYGALRIPQVDAAREPAPRVKIALLQPSIDALERWRKGAGPGILDKLSAMTRVAEERGAELTVWPEAAYPFPVASDSRISPLGTRAILQPGVHGPVLTGLVMNGEPGRSYNSAAIATEGGALSAPQHKMHLLWFGETVPFADRIAWLRDTFARGVGLVPGDRNIVLEAGAVRAAVLNCFEDTLPDAAREAMTARPNLLVNVTNDAWFVGSEESELHLRLAVLRAVELRRDLVRAVNHGPTSWIDASGRIRARYTETGPLLTAPALLDGAPTLYARLGDAPLAGCMLVCGVFALGWRRRRASNP